MSFLHALQKRNSRVIFQTLMFLSLNSNTIKFLLLENFHIFSIVLLLTAKKSRSGENENQI